MTEGRKRDYFKSYLTVFNSQQAVMRMLRNEKNPKKFAQYAKRYYIVFRQARWWLERWRATQS